MGYKEYLRKNYKKQECFDIDRYLSDKKQEFEKQLANLEIQANNIRQLVKSGRNDMKKIVQDNEKELKILFKNRSLKSTPILTDIKLPWDANLIENLKDVMDRIICVHRILENSEKEFEKAKGNVKTLERYN